MNTGTQSYPLVLRFFIAFGLAIGLTVLVMLALAVDSGNRLSEQNLQAFVREGGTYRQFAITNNMEQVQDAIENVFADPETTEQIAVAAQKLQDLNLPASERGTVTEQITTRLSAELFRNQSRLIESAWILDPAGKVIASVTNGSRTLPFTLSSEREETSDSFLTAQNIAQTGQVEAFVIAQRNGVPDFEIVRIIRNNALKVTGYLVVNLDIPQVVLASLNEKNEGLPAYSYMVLPDAVDSIQDLDVRRQKLVNVNNVAVGRALDGQAPNVLTYDVITDITRTVIGYYSTVEVLGTRLALITEVDRGIIAAQRLEYFERFGFPLFVGLAALLTTLVLLVNQIVVPPLEQLRRAIKAITLGNYEVPIAFAGRGDDIGLLGSEFVDMRAQVKQLISDMRARLQERSRDVQLTQEISRAALAERDLQVLLSKIVNLISDNFSNIYHAQIFLLDTDEKFAILRASTGRVGQELLQRGHRLPVGGVSVIGQVTDQGRLMLVRDINAGNLHRVNELLSETQAELAMPLLSRSRVIGALDVQSRLRDSFSEDQIAALQTLADQVTIAIENARLYEQSQQLLQTIERESADRTRRSWQNVFSAQRSGVLSGRYGNPTGYDHTALNQAAAHSRRPIVGEQTERATLPVALPVLVRDQLIGVVEFEIRAVDFSYNKVLLAEELVNRLSVSLDNARLFQDSAQTAQREQLVNDIGNRLTTQNDIESIVQTAIREVSEALGTPQVAIRFQMPKRDAVETPSSNGHHATPEQAVVPTMITPEGSES